MAEGGHIQLPGETGWWAPLGQLYYSPGDIDTPVQELAERAQAHFLLGRRAVDAFGATTRIGYGRLRSVADHGHRRGRQRHDGAQRLPGHGGLDTIVDANGNRIQVAFDAREMVAGQRGHGARRRIPSAIRWLASSPIWTTPRSSRIWPISFADPGSILGSATIRSHLRHRCLLPHPDRGRNRRRRPSILRRAKRTWATSRRGQTTAHQHSFAYADGFQRVAQSKTQAAPGPLTVGGPAAATRWVGSGWT